VVADLRITRTVVNPAIGELRAPADARRAAEPPGAATVTVSEEAPGVWYLAGEGHHSVAVDLGDHLTLIEAPVDDRRTLAVIARARALRPGKPLTEVINTHHHFDHSGGIRAAVSEGLRVVTHESNRGFFEAMVARPATVRPDALARRPRPLTMETVGDKLVLGEGMRRLEVYQVTGSRHCATMLMVYLPGERLLVEADAYQPAPLQGRPPVSHPHAANLLENIERRGLRVDRLLPIHGRPVPFGELVAAAKTSPPPD
jgi:glyoxylase-like metal-dependent hydrolase (beta-lactamase superfamily II)